MVNKLAVIPPERLSRNMLFTPSELSAYSLKFVEEMRAPCAYPWGVLELDNPKVFVPPRAGNVITIIARPGHGKTSVAAHLAKAAAAQIIKHGDPEHEAVVYVTLEQTVEEMNVFFQADAEYGITDVMSGEISQEIVLRKAMERASLPIWVVGETGLDVERPHNRLTINAIYETLQNMRAVYGIIIKNLYLDYIQIVPTENGTERVQQVTEGIIRAKELARALRCPITLCAQASREVDKQQEQIPTLGSSGWSAAMEHVSSKMLGLWRPILTHKAGKVVSVENRKYTITQQLLIMKMLKQRYGPAGRVFALELTPNFAHLAKLEIDNHINWEGEDAEKV